MELNFTEIDNTDTQKYWEPNKIKNKLIKKRVTFDDILSNMNLVVNKDGILQAMSPIQKEEQNSTYYNQNQILNQQINTQPIDPSIKHSFIYNKYFKDYKDVNDTKISEIRKPKTIEELKQMLLDDKLKRIREAHRIAQIKSTKLLFTGNPIIQQQNIHHSIQASKNNLRQMNFR